jgi:hypothetical protein
LFVYQSHQSVISYLLLWFLVFFFFFPCLCLIYFVFVDF